MSTHKIHFYDAANSHNVPSGVHAAVYVNSFPWSESEIRRMGKIFKISERPEAFWAAKARCIAVEPGAAEPKDVPGFLAVRLEHGYRDGTVYVNRSNWDAVKAEVKAHESELHGFVPFYWVATLDGTQDVPGAWAVQFHGGQNAPFDVSILHGIDNFHRP